MNTGKNVLIKQLKFALLYRFFIFVTLSLCCQKIIAADLRVMKTGLGGGTVTSSISGINCGSDCDQNYPDSTTVSLSASPAGDAIFVGWEGDCSGMGACTVAMNSVRSVRAVFDLSVSIPLLTDFTPSGIETYLTNFPFVDTVPKFIAALPDDFLQNWILMTRSESLQTGTAAMPRILMPSDDSRFVFSLGLSTSSSYPGAHPNAIEYMQWDAIEKNFRFHEIIIDAIPTMDPDGDGVGVLPARTRGVTVDDEKCSRCHSTRNIINHTATSGTSGITPGTIKVKNKPNWDPYDSWGGMMPFNRDRIYKGSVEAAAFRKIFNPWHWRNNDFVREIIEQLHLQPSGVPIDDEISRIVGGANDGLIRFPFDDTTPVLIEPNPDGITTISTNYNFNNTASGAATEVERDGSFVTLHHSVNPTSDEGRGVQLFDTIGGLDGNLNQLRIADEVESHRWATGNYFVDTRPLAFAISRNCFSINSASNTVTSSPAHGINLGFFNSRNGMMINQLVNDTRTRMESVPRRKADIQKLNLNRNGDLYSVGTEAGVIQEYGGDTSAGSTTSLERIRQDVFRRRPLSSQEDNTVMAGIYVDREDYGANVNIISLFRYFLEPLGISVDKWSLGTRGRSRTYAFADVFTLGGYQNALNNALSSSLGLSPSASCATIIPLVNSSLASLPDVNDVPTYTDIQRIFNKSCIECHGGLDYPPYQNYGSFLNLSENETPTSGDDKLARAHSFASGLVSTDPATSFLYNIVTNPSEDCPFPGMMPCGGPALSKADTETIRRWIVGSSPNTRGDPHILTVDGTRYDFQAAGEFVLLKDAGFELQVRQMAVETNSPVGPNNHTGLTTCASLNNAVAIKIGPHRITYQPDLYGKPNPEGMELRIDGKAATFNGNNIFLSQGGRILRTLVDNGIQIEAPGGTSVTISPQWWNAYSVWYMNIDVRSSRATQGLMGNINTGNWLPSLATGEWLGPRPLGLQQRYDQLYNKFGENWRVDEKTSLFDYAPGMSTKDFTIASWPLGESPKECVIPPEDGGPRHKPLEGMPLDKAKEICRGIIGKEELLNCIQDVQATGEPGFAKLLRISQKLEQNHRPVAPMLRTPKAFAGTKPTVQFIWQATVDKENQPLRYWHCLWPNTKKQTFEHCKVVAETDPRKSSDQEMVYSVDNLKPGGVYYWKILVEDSHNATVESEMRRFTVK